MRHLRLLPLLCLLQIADAYAESAIRWVSGSYVNVRAAGNKQAEVLERLVVNTQVQQISREKEFCQVSWESASTKSIRTGFIACNFLSARQLTLADVDQDKLPNGLPNPNVSAARAFWLEPTWGRLMSFGHYLDATMVPAKQLKIETDYAAKGDWGPSTPNVIRPTVAEFDAMKSLLASGVIAPKNLAIFAQKWDGKGSGSVQDTQSSFPWAFSQIRLPKVKPSLFKDVAEVAGPYRSPEQLSAQFQVPWRLSVIEPAGWSGDSNSGPNRSGVWNMGKVTQQLVNQTTVHAIRNEQQLIFESFPDKSQYQEVPGVDFGHCSANYMATSWPGRAEPLIPLFRTAKPMTFPNAKLRTTKQKLKQPYPNPDAPIFIRAETTFIDLDADGIEDVAFWHGINTQVGLGDNGEYALDLIFMNVKGVWFLLDQVEDEIVCGC